MTTSFPTSIDSLTNPLPTDTLTSPSHADQHSNANDAIEAIETAIGTTAAPVLAKLASPTFTGVPSAPTAAPLTNTTQIATTAFVTTADNLKANLASPTFTGTPTLPTGTIATTQTAADSSTKVATTAFVTTADNLKANLASPTFTGTVTAPTFSGALTGNASTVTTNANLTGDVTSVGNATTLTNAPVIAKVLTGYVSGSGTVAATDSILQAVQKLNGNDVLKANIASPTFTGIPAAPTATAGTSTTQLATTAFVTTADQLLGTYTAYTPTLTNITIGNGTITASYCRVNNFVHAIGKILFGSTTVVTAANINATLPVNADTSPTNVPWGWVSFVDQSAGSIVQGTGSLSASTGLLWFQVLVTSGSYATMSNISSTVPFTWANTDYISFNIYYKAA